ncbi:MAG TPA: hypothetical protein VEY92_08535 [Pseudoxanthomonas sp.]|nr:hypothetical protein [Pseudoxanthomonas sp.]
MKFGFSWVPMKRKGCRYYVRYGATTMFRRGFNNKQEASDWIEMLYRSGVVDWRVGFLFRVKGDEFDVEIVDRLGRRI